MSFVAPYKTLKELFPQVDDRLLKAAALEHVHELESAINFIVNEALPYMGSKSATANALGTPCFSTGVESKDLLSSPEKQGTPFRLESHEDFPTLANASMFPDTTTIDLEEDSSTNPGLVSIECSTETVPSVQNAPKLFDLMESHVPFERNINTSSTKNDEPWWQKLHDGPEDLVSDEKSSMRAAEESLSTSAVGHTSQIINIDFLEDLINNGKKNKEAAD